MLDVAVRAVYMDPDLAAELWRRGLFSSEEKREIAALAERWRRILRLRSDSAPLGSRQFVTLLAHADTKMAARAVLRNLLSQDELDWLERLLRVQKPVKKRDHLIRIVERALEGRGRNVRESH